MPLVYAVAFYLLVVLPNEATINSTIFFLSGFYLGNLLLWIDGKILYPYYNELRTEPKQLITRSAVFMLVYVFLALFVITSSGNYVGTGMIFGIGLTLLSEIFSLRNNSDAFHHKFLFQLKRRLSQLEVLRLVQGFCLVILVLTIFFFF
jgi:hypothetical protein